MAVLRSIPLAYLGDRFGARGAKQVCDELQLMHHVAPRKERLPKQDLREDAADGPDVDGGSILGKEGAAELGSTVPGDEAAQQETARFRFTTVLPLEQSSALALFLPNPTKLLRGPLPSGQVDPETSRTATWGPLRLHRMRQARLLTSGWRRSPSRRPLWACR